VTSDVLMHFLKYVCTLCVKSSPILDCKRWAQSWSRFFGSQ